VATPHIYECIDYGELCLEQPSVLFVVIATFNADYQLVLLSCAYALVLPFGFVAPSAGDAAMMTLNGAGNGLAQYWWTRALHMAPTAAVVPFNYLSLVWAVIFGFAIWGDVPTVGLLIGSAVVVASGLFLLWHESRRAVVPDGVA
jgi:drug/metabolite transporter (DMT)-like permease